MSDTTPHNEHELLLQIARGDENAFNKVFHTYHNRLGAFVMKLTGSLPATEEIVQDVFLKIWLKRELLPEIEHFNAWLYTLTRNHTFTYLKKLGRELARKQEWENTLEENTDNNPEPDALDFYQELIKRAVAELPPQQQKVYLLSREEGLRQAEIAERLTISLETVKKHMVLALKFIRTRLTEKGDEMILLIMLTPLFF